MPLDYNHGYTEDGLVFMQFIGSQHGKPVQTTITIEPDQAVKFGQGVIDAANRAIVACKRPLIVGQDQTIKKGG